MSFDVKGKQGHILPSSFLAIENSNQDNSLDNNSFHLDEIDEITVDKKSRITFTKNIKKIFSIKPNDKIQIYQNRYSKNIIFKVQRNGDIVGSWLLSNNNENNKIINSFSTTSNNIAITGLRGDKNFKNNITTINSNKSYDESHKKDIFYASPIILVDDEKEIVEFIECLLHLEGFKNVKAFCDSKSALNDISYIEKCKLAILDIRMPTINGIHLNQILKILNPAIKTIFVTALDAVNELATLSDIKPENILTKPFDSTDFVEKITNTMKSSIL
jgi:CheY-like chemotaxis protein